MYTGHPGSSGLHHTESREINIWDWGKNFSVSSLLTVWCFLRMLGTFKGFAATRSTLTKSFKSIKESLYSHFSLPSLSSSWCLSCSVSYICIFIFIVASSFSLPQMWFSNCILEWWPSWMMTLYNPWLLVRGPAQLLVVQLVWLELAIDPIAIKVVDEPINLRRFLLHSKPSSANKCWGAKCKCCHLLHKEPDR